MKKRLLILLCGLALTACNNEKFDANKEIKCYTRDTSSGTRDGFFTSIGLSEAKEDNAPLVEGTVEAKTNDDMITKIKNDIYGIGYISLASYDSSELKGLDYNNVEPTEENVLNSTYELTRNFNYMVRSEFKDQKTKDIVEAFRAFLSTKDAKLTIKDKDGIVEINNDDPTWESIKDNYPVCKEDNSNVTIKFGGSTSCDKMARALSSEFATKCGNFIPEHNHTGSSDAYKRTQGSEKDGSNYLDIGFASREFNLTDSEPAAEGTYAKICVDAIVTVVNLENSLEKITNTQLVSIYTGEYLTWKDIM